MLQILKSGSLQGSAAKASLNTMGAMCSRLMSSTTGTVDGENLTVEVRFGESMRSRVFIYLSVQQFSFIISRRRPHSGYFPLSNQRKPEKRRLSLSTREQLIGILMHHHHQLA